jgi:hypothetical protein
MATQKALIHIYKTAAALPDHQYRQILAENSGCRSAADERMSQSGWEKAMASLEGVLFDRVSRGLVPNPIGRNRWIKTEFYWRNRLPRGGKINTRQHHTIRELWDQLTPYLPESCRTTAYFSGIVEQATKKGDLGVTALTSHESGLVIDALKDRLTYAIRNANQVAA